MTHYGGPEKGKDEGGRMNDELLRLIAGRSDFKNTCVCHHSTFLSHTLR